MIEDHYCLPNRGFRTGGQDDTTTGDVISFSTETKPVRENHWLRMCVPFDDIFFSSERSLTIERVRGGPFTFAHVTFGPRRGMTKVNGPPPLLSMVGDRSLLKNGVINRYTHS